MDKQTLSNYGWITVCVLVIAVMLALATPFGLFVADGFKTSYVGFDDVGTTAMNAAGLDVESANGSGNNGSGTEPQPSEFNFPLYTASSNMYGLGKINPDGKPLAKKVAVEAASSYDYNERIKVDNCMRWQVPEDIAKENIQKYFAVSDAEVENLKTQTTDGTLHKNYYENGVFYICGCAVGVGGPAPFNHTIIGYTDNGSTLSVYYDYTSFEGYTHEYYYVVNYSYSNAAEYEINKYQITSESEDFINSLRMVSAQKVSDVTGITTIEVPTPSCYHNNVTVTVPNTSQHRYECTDCGYIVTCNCFDEDTNSVCDECGNCTHLNYVNVPAGTINGVPSHWIECANCSASKGHASCTDTDTNDLCDECGNDMTPSVVPVIPGIPSCEHEDLDADYYCDLCNENICSHTTTEQSHYTINGVPSHGTTCTTCNYKLNVSPCADNDSDGFCDGCNACLHLNTPTSISHGTNYEGKLMHEIYCEYCHARISLSFSDADEDGECDICATICQHENVSMTYDATRHYEICSDCSFEISSSLHKFNSDGSCRNCDYICEHTETTITALPAGTSHRTTCVNCKAMIGSTIKCTDTNGDGACDICGAVPCTHPETKVLSMNNGSTHQIRCSTCNSIITNNITCTDENSDSVCDVCGQTICAHNYVNGVCSNCGNTCRHTSTRYVSNGDGTHSITCTACSYVTKTANCSTSSYVSNGDGTHTGKCKCNGLTNLTAICADKDANGLCDGCKANLGD